MSKVLNKEGFLVTVDIKKAFNPANHLFLIAILENFRLFKCLKQRLFNYKPLVTTIYLIHLQWKRPETSELWRFNEKYKKHPWY